MHFADYFSSVMMIYDEQLLIFILFVEAIGIPTDYIVFDIVGNFVSVGNSSYDMVVVAVLPSENNPITSRKHCNRLLISAHDNT